LTANTDTTMQPVLLSLPDDLIDWRGTAAELADRLNQVLSGIPSLTDDAGSANERLVRHYVQVGVLTPPEREGREALFGLRQVVEFLAARYLLKDGWPLAKVAELVRTTDVEGLARLIPAERPRTRAEEVVAKYRRGRTADTPDASASVRSQIADPSHHVSAETFALTPQSAPSMKRPAVQKAMKLESPPSSPLAVAAGISRRRVSLEENLKALGNTAGRPDRSRVVRIALTPWCHVDVDLAALGEMSEDTPEVLGAALTQALQEERIQKGK
jgi:DNA-binding transcriptional MerR regulator